MFFTKDTHPEEYLDTREGRRLPVELRETALGGCAVTPSACQRCGACQG